MDGRLRCKSLTHWVDHEHALHDVLEGSTAGVREGVIHPLHYCLEQPSLVLCLERQSALRSPHNALFKNDRFPAEMKGHQNVLFLIHLGADR